MRKKLAAAALAVGVTGALAGCGGGHGYTTVANETYCVNQASGEVMPPQYCQVGSTFYNPGMYDFWIGPTYGHSYHAGVVIQHNYFVSGRQVKPTDTAGRKAAGIPVSGSVSNGARSTTTTRTSGSTPAKPQNSPSRTGVSGSTSSRTSTSTRTSTTPRTSTFGSSGSTSRSSSTFGSSGSSSRSSSSFGSSGGRK